MLVFEYQFHKWKNTAVMGTSYSQDKNMQYLSNKQGSFTAFSCTNTLVQMPLSAVSSERKSRKDQNHNTPLALKGVDMKCKCKCK